MVWDQLPLGPPGGDLSLKPRPRTKQTTKASPMRFQCCGATMPTKLGKVVDCRVVQLNMNTPRRATAARSHGCTGLPRPSGSNDFLRRAGSGTKRAGWAWPGTKRLSARGWASHGHARIKPPSKPSAVNYIFAAFWSYERCELLSFAHAAADNH